MNELLYDALYVILFFGSTAFLLNIQHWSEGARNVALTWFIIIVVIGAVVLGLQGE